MPPQDLRSYFEKPEQQRRALSELGDWFDPKELDIYENSRRAFNPSVSPVEALQEFTRIYDELKGPNWQVFRSRTPAASRWPASQSGFRDDQR
jgi:hypothetical protein